MPEDVIRHQDHFYILATTTRSHEPTRVLKHDDLFVVFDRFGDVQALGLGEQGLYFEGTRYLSRLVLRLGPERPMLLSSRVRADNDLFGADLTNPDLTHDGAIVLPRELVHFFRSRFVWKHCCFERVRVWSYAPAPIELPLWFLFDADYADIFEVRGLTRQQRGRMLDPLVKGSEVILGYEGLDGETRRTRLTWSPPPGALDTGAARYMLRLSPHESVTLELCVSCERGKRRPPRVTLDEAAAARAAVVERRGCTISTSNERFNAWLDRSWSDLRMMVSETPHGIYPYAGVPWFSTPFGRDGIITAREMLWIDPAVARGVLSYLAATQADRLDQAQDAEPGKILHETREGEMAVLGEIPFGRYYGSVDATPLFVSLAGAYYRRTGDRELIETIWPAVDRALAWIDRFGDRDGDGFVEYARQSATGLVHQGWKDSPDAIFHEDSALADPPIALCEVQAYIYDAKRQAAALAEIFGDPRRAASLRADADALRDRFERDFWIDELGTYALALDGAKRPCRVRSSNAGHALFCGIAAPHRAQRIARGLLGPEMYSGWGVRTVAASELRYNPMSYHNGSIWPHDNALIAEGFNRYGLKADALAVLTGLFEVSHYVDLHRMPELFCGFHRRAGEGPTLYPVACAPQAWAAGAVYLLIEACLGLSIDGVNRRIILRDPRLPEFLREIRVTGLAVGGSTIDILFERHAHDVGVTVLRKDGAVELQIVK